MKRRPVFETMPEPGKPVPLGQFYLEDRRFPAVYFLCRRGEVVYVGQSKTLKLRIDQHLEGGKKVFDAVAFIRCTIDRLTEIEAHYIRRYLPKYNDCGLVKKTRKREAWRAERKAKLGVSDLKPGDPIVVLDAAETIIPDAEIGDFLMVSESDAKAFRESGDMTDRSIVGLLYFVARNRKNVAKAQEAFEAL